MTDIQAILHLRSVALCALVLAGCQKEPFSDPAQGTPPIASSSLYCPPHPSDDEWQTVTPTEAGYDGAALEEVLSYAESQRSSGVVVLYDGKILVERYWEVPEKEGSRYTTMVAAATPDGRAIEDVASAQKNIVSFLAGVASGKGLLDLGAPVSDYIGEGWSKATVEQEAAITVEHLLSMSSGLLADRTFEAAAGEKWRYNTSVYSRMFPILESVSGLSLEECTAQWLTMPTGMSESSWVPRPWVKATQDANVVGFGTSARDLARFGLLLMREGLWNGNDVLNNPGYVARSTSPSQELNPAYGYLWWLNGQQRRLTFNREEIEGQYIRNAPPDLYAAEGALGRKCYVVPSLKIIVTRLGDQPERNFNEKFWRLFMDATP